MEKSAYDNLKGYTASSSGPIDSIEDIFRRYLSRVNVRSWHINDSRGRIINKKQAIKKKKSLWHPHPLKRIKFKALDYAFIR
jgi:hypothetical protein